MPRKSSRKTRSLRPDDLKRVIEIDTAILGRSRRGFFEKRLEAAVAAPDNYVAVGVTDGDRLLGFAFARVHAGDFGAEGPLAALDAIGVDPRLQKKGAGRALMAALDERLRRRGVAELRTQADWRYQRLLRFFDAVGCSLAPIHILERSTTTPL